MSEKAAGGEMFLHDRRSALSSYIADRKSKGLETFSAEEAEEELGMEHETFLRTAKKLVKDHLIVSPRSGFYVIVADGHLHFGGPPPEYYIDAMMRFTGSPYYIGLFTAAFNHGASHQGIMLNQIVTDKPRKPISLGRSKIKFIQRNNMEEVAHAVEWHDFIGAHANMSSPELTALDVMYFKRIGSVNFKVTILSELTEKIRPKALAELSMLFDKPTVQRLGYLLDFLNYKDQASCLHEALEIRGSLSWVELNKGQVFDPIITPDPIVLDRKWRVIVRRLPDPDV